MNALECTKTLFLFTPASEFPSPPTPSCVYIAREITSLFFFFVTHATDFKNMNILKDSLSAYFNYLIVWCSTSQDTAWLCNSSQFTFMLVAKIVISPVVMGFEPAYKMSKMLTALWGTVTVWSVSRPLYPIQNR